MLEIVFFCLLASERLTISSRKLKSLIILVPIIGTLLIFLYIYASLVRTVSVGNMEAADLPVTLLNVAKDGQIVNWLGRIASRVGSLDFTVELIANAEQYKHIFDVSFYSKAFLDNVLSPGFDYFDTPRVAQSMVFEYTNANNHQISKSYINNGGNPHSDEITIFGELYAFAGVLLFPLLVVFSAIIKLCFYQLSGRVAYGVVLKRVLFIYFMSKGLHSFGLDWLFVDAVKFTIPCVFMYFILFPPKMDSLFANTKGNRGG